MKFENKNSTSVSSLDEYGTCISLNEILSTKREIRKVFVNLIVIPMTFHAT